MVIFDSLIFWTYRSFRAVYCIARFKNNLDKKPYSLILVNNIAMY